MNIRVLAVVLAAAVALSGGAACAAPSPVAETATGGPTPSGTRSTDTGWLARGDCRAVAGTAADTATGDTVLTVRAHGASSAVTMAQLDALPQVECTVDDRQAEGRTATFRGALLADVLTVVGTPPAEDGVLHALAVNDYAVELPVSDIRDYPVLLATRLDGHPMDVAHYGPLRVVYPTAGFDLDPTVYDPRWIWQLVEITL